MALAWHDEVFAAEVDGVHILLDVRRGRYSAVGSDVSAALRRAWTAAEPAGDDGHLVAPLIEAGLIIAERSVRPAPRSQPLPPTAQLRAAPGVSVPNGDLLVAFLAQVLARGSLRLLGFARLHRLLGRAAFDGGGTLGDRSVAVERLAASLARTETLFSRNDRCLARTIAFRLAALAMGLDVRLVIGVRRSPFEAHCWAERRGVVLNDELDVVTRFVPLLAV